MNSATLLRQGQQGAGKGVGWVHFTVWPHPLYPLPTITNTPTLTHAGSAPLLVHRHVASVLQHAAEDVAVQRRARHHVLGRVRRRLAHQRVEGVCGGSGRGEAVVGGWGSGEVRGMLES